MTSDAKAGNALQVVPPHITRGNIIILPDETPAASSGSEVAPTIKFVAVVQRVAWRLSFEVTTSRSLVSDEVAAAASESVAPCRSMTLASAANSSSSLAPPPLMGWQGTALLSVWKVVERELLFEW